MIYMHHVIHQILTVGANRLCHRRCIVVFDVVVAAVIVVVVLVLVVAVVVVEKCLA